MYTNQTAKEIAQALRSIINTDEDSTCSEYLIVSNQEDAETLSQIFIDASEGGSITGPYLQSVGGSPTRVWNVSIQ